MATIQGKIHSAAAVPLQTSLEFETVSAPVLGSDYVVSKTRKNVSTDPLGLFTISLEAGDYLVRWLNGITLTEVRISVPASSLTYQFHTLVTSAVVFTYTVSPLYVLQAPPNGSFRIKDGQHIQLWNPSTTKWHTLVASGPDGALQLGLGAGEN